MVEFIHSEIIYTRQTIKIIKNTYNRILKKDRNDICFLQSVI